MKHPSYQKGVGLIEALIAAVVFAVGISAIVQLQGNFFKNSSAANARSIAVGIAQEKLEDLRSFQVRDSPDPDIFTFTSISGDGGGRRLENCTLPIVSDTDNSCPTLVLPSGTVSKDNITFSRSWTVTPYYYNGGVLTTTPNGDIVQKLVTVNVTWTDTDNTNQSASLNTVINKFSGASATGALAYNIGGSGEKPEVPYTASTDSHVTPIGVGTDTKRETLVPSSETVDNFSRTKFIAYTYNSGGVLVREEEFQNVACNCRFDGVSGDDFNHATSGTSDDPTFAVAHPTWSIAKDTYIDVDGELVSGKAKGCVQGGGNNCASNPEPICEICCRDHHDISSVARKFDPFRSSDDFTVAGDHKHYSGTSPVTSGKYLEACRMKRVDGNWRVFQDWNLVKFTVLPLSDLEDSTTKATYTDFVQDVIDQHLDENKVSGEALTSPPAKPSSLDHTVSGNYVTMNVGDRRELTARAVYLDFIDSTHLTKVKDKKTAGLDYLLHLPFYEIEVAPVSGWQSATPTKVRVGPFDDNPGTANDLTGGQLLALATNTEAVTVTATIKKSNSGIVALSSAVDFNAAANPDSETNSGTVNVCVGCTSAPSNDCSLPWGGTITDGSTATAYQSAAVASGDSCVSETRTCTNGTLSGSFIYDSCSVLPAEDCTTPWGTSVADGGSVTAYLASSVVSPDVCTSETRDCSNGTLSGSYTSQSCAVTVETCATTVTGKANDKDDTITLSVNGSPTSCSVANSQSYTCPAVTSPLTAVITVTSSGTVDSTITVTPICGAKTVNF